MSRYSGFGSGEQSNFFSVVIAIGLILAGLLAVNVQLNFIALEFDVANPTYQLIVGLFSVVGGVLIFFQTQQRHY